MNRRTTPLLTAFALFASTLSGHTCGPDFPTAVFVKKNGPDLPYEKYVSGRLGVPQPGYRIRHLVVAYRWLNGTPLSKAEQSEAFAVNKDLTASWPETQSNAEDSGLTVWVKARAAFGLVDKFTPTKDLDISRLVPGSQYELFPNCFDDAFKTAARTLTAREKQYGQHDSAVKEWVRGQDAVFSNCGDGHPHTYFGPGQPPPPPPAPHMPLVVSDAPLWLKQDRAYQLAAAQFYATDFDHAMQSFQAIGKDSSSPWQILSRYLVGRAMLRKADVTYSVATQNYNMNATDRTSKDRDMHAGYLTARAYFLSLRSDAQMLGMSHTIDGMIDFINAHVEPEKQSLVLASRIQHENDSSFYQDLTDLTIIRINEAEKSSESPESESPEKERKQLRSTFADRDAVDLLYWVDAMSTSDEATALEQWRKTRKPVWLVAALSFAKPDDTAANELIAASSQIAASDPAWPAVNYHRLRLLPRNEAMRSELLAALPRIDRDEGASATNLFAALNASTAPDLKSWLSQIGRVPAAEFYDGDEDNAPGVPYDDDPPSKTFARQGCPALHSRRRNHSEHQVATSLASCLSARYGAPNKSAAPDCASRLGSCSSTGQT